MANLEKQTILVTGTPRSGTTWIGRVLASAPKTAYVLEPLNLSRAEHFDLPVSHWYQRLTADSDPQFDEVFGQVSNGNDIGRGDPVGLSSLAAPVATAKQLACRMRDRVNARRAKRIILKDPIAILSADWFADRFDAQVVVTIRHPAAVVSSMRLQGWSPDFDDLFHQPEVIEQFFPDVFQWLNANPISPGQDETLYKGAVLWRLLHRVILHYREKYPNWVYVRHEDLSRDITGGFKKLFEQLDLPFTAPTADFLTKTTSSTQRVYVNQAAPTNVVQRDTVKNIQIWKERLTPQEIKQIRDLTDGIADQFYAAQDW